MRRAQPDIPHRDDIDVQAAHWQLHTARGLDAGQQARLQAWLAQSAAHRDAFAAMQALDTLIAAVPASRRPAGAAGRSSPARWPLAAAASLLLAIGGGWLWRDYRLNQPLQQSSMASARGQQRTLQLADGSMLTLDSASRATLTLYRDRRELVLTQGQLLLQVAHDATRPFSVLADSTRVTVLGTRFAVRKVGRSRAVAVQAGRVRVRQYASAADAARDWHPRQESVLHGGQQVVGDAERLHWVLPIAPAAVAGWRHGRLVFDNTPLTEVLAEFARYGDSGLRLRDAATGRWRLTGSFNAYRPQQFAAALPQVLPVQLQPRAGGWWIAAR